MRRFALASGASLWFSLVFWAFFTWMFPSDTMAKRIAYEVEAATDGAYHVAMDGLRPWGLGGQAKNVQVLNLKDSTKDGVSTPIFSADKVRMQVSPLSLVTRSPRVAGGVELGDGYLNFSARGLANDRVTQLVLAELDIDGSALPLSLLKPVVGGEVQADGGFDLKVKLDMVEGFRMANGIVSLKSQNLLIRELGIATTMLSAAQVEEIAVEDLRLVFRIREGKAEVKRGQIKASFGEVSLNGDIQLRDRIGRSVLDLTLMLELDDDLAAFAPFLAPALQGNGKYAYEINGTLSSPIFRPKTARSSNRRGQNPTVERRSQRIQRGDDDEGEGTTTTRRQRRQELREKMRERRQQRKEQEEDELEEEDLDDEVYEDDEDFDEEDLDYDDELEEEELDDEEFFDDEDVFED